MSDQTNTKIFPKNTPYHQIFTSSNRPHILMITNHGVHEWQVVPGLPDTGGQNVFVNQFSNALAKCGFRITIANRGGYPHPVTGEVQCGLHYADQHQRILYLEDGVDLFIRKEDMHAQIPALVDYLVRYIEREDTHIDLIISHYWDAALIGTKFEAQIETERRDQLNNRQTGHIPHFWVPHSLGLLKKTNVAEEKWAGLRIDERITTEMSLINRLDGIVATSSVIQTTLTDDYGYYGPDLFLPPCVDIDRYQPRVVSDTDPIWTFLSKRTGLPPQKIRHLNIITEISRTDTTKRKDVLIKAFSRMLPDHPESLLVISIDERRPKLAAELRNLIASLDIGGHVAVVGSIWDILPTLYAISDIYCTPSVMEGFGMSAQEAAATSVPVVASNLVPFVVEYLLGGEPEEMSADSQSNPILVGDGAIVVQADDVDGFALALSVLLGDSPMRRQMGKMAYRATIPYFTWSHRVKVFLEQIESASGVLQESCHG